jgi:hypothetical protein
MNGTPTPSPHPLLVIYIAGGGWDAGWPRVYEWHPYTIIDSNPHAPGYLLYCRYYVIRAFCQDTKR